MKHQHNATKSARPNIQISPDRRIGGTIYIYTEGLFMFLKTQTEFNSYIIYFLEALHPHRRAVAVHLIQHGASV